MNNKIFDYITTTPHNTNKAILKQMLEEIENKTTSWNDLEDKPFGETTVNGDTLTWDGNSEGLESFDIGDVTAYLVSNIIITYDDIKNGYAIVTSNGETYESDAEATKFIWEMTGFMYGPSFAIIPTDNFIFADLNFTFPKAGVYFWDDGESYCASLTIPGYTGFESTTVKTIDPKYLPKAPTIPDLTATPTAEDFNALLAALREAGYLAT